MNNLLPQPNATAITVQGILHALSDPTRMAIFSSLQEADAPCNCSAFLKVDQKAIPKSTLSQHFKILREAGLITSEKRGVEVINRSRCDDLKDTWGPMIQAIITAYVRQLTS